MRPLINLSRDYLTDCGDDGTALRRQPRFLITCARARFEMIEMIDTADLNYLAGIVKGGLRVVVPKSQGKQQQVQKQIPFGNDKQRRVRMTNKGT